CGKAASHGGIHQTHLVPAALVTVYLCGALLHLRVGLKVSQHHIGVNLGQGVVDILEVHTAESALQFLHGAADDGVVVHILIGMIAVLLQGVHLGGGQTKQEDVVVAHSLVNLHICAVQRTHGHGGVDHELHVGGTGSLGAGQRDLLADFSG